MAGLGLLIIGSQLSAQAAMIRQDTIPFVLTEYNNVKCEVSLDGRDTLQLKFDSGANGLLLTHDAIARKTALLAGKTGEAARTRDYERLPTLHRLQLGRLSWDSMEVYPVTHSGQGTDGRFGWDLFKGKVLEINYDQGIMVVHDALPKKLKGYTRLDIEYVSTLFCISGKLKVKGKKYTNRFLFDNGYQRAMLLDSVLMEEQHFPKDQLRVIKTNSLRNGRGDVFITRIINSDALTLGKYTLADIPTQLLNTANPAGFKTHILGNELLKRFNTFLDFQHGRVYLKPNGLAHEPYVDAS